MVRRWSRDRGREREFYINNSFRPVHGRSQEVVDPNDKLKDTTLIVQGDRGLSFNHIPSRATPSLNKYPPANRRNTSCGPSHRPSRPRDSSDPSPGPLPRPNPVSTPLSPVSPSSSSNLWVYPQTNRNPLPSLSSSLSSFLVFKESRGVFYLKIKIDPLVSSKNGIKN